MADEVIALDSRRERYRKLVVKDGRLSGATLLGELGDARTLRELIANGAPVPEALLELGGAEHRPERPPRLLLPGRLGGEIRAAIAEHSLTTVEAVSERTGAATGCGGCRPDVEALLEA